MQASEFAAGKTDDYINFKSSCSQAKVGAIRPSADELYAALCAWTDFQRHYRDCIRQVQQKRSENQLKERGETIDPDTMFWHQGHYMVRLTSGASMSFRDAVQMRAHKDRW